MICHIVSTHLNLHGLSNQRTLTVAYGSERNRRTSRISHYFTSHLDGQRLLWQDKTFEGPVLLSRVNVRRREVYEKLGRDTTVWPSIVLLAGVRLAAILPNIRQNIRVAVFHQGSETVRGFKSQTAHTAVHCDETVIAKFSLRQGKKLDVAYV